MPWPVPAPGDIASRAASVLEGALPGIDARSPNNVATAFTRVTELGLFDLYFYQGYLAAELMPDTAVDTLARHANIWGVPQLQPTAAVGNAVFAGTPAAPIPLGLTFTAPSGAVVATSASGTIGGGGTVTLPVVATVAGSAGNLPGGTVLTIVSPIEGLNPQSCTLDSNGLAGGTDLEATESWRARILACIRQPAMGGAPADYATWAQEVLPGCYVQVVPNATGLGTVAIWIAMPGPAAASPAEVTEAQAYINTVRPVTAAATVQAASLVPINVTLHLIPDTPTIRAAASQALALSIAQDAAIGGTIYVERLDTALSTDGGFACDMSVPSADVVLATGQIPVLGTVTFV
jgi:uncharacterized phage protein gp47/JayE